jgi:hypothetical protein
MLLESVPALHGGRDPALLADRQDRCLSHEQFPGADAEAPANDHNPLMAEIEPGHLLTCAFVDQPQACPSAATSRAA